MNNVLPKNLLHVSQNFHVVGGSDSYFFSLTKLLEESGVEVVPFAAQSERNFPSQWSEYFPRSANFSQSNPLNAMRYVYSLSAKENIRKLIELKRFDVAHLHIYYGKLTSSILAPLKEARIPIVQTLHEYKLLCPVYTCVQSGQICESCGGSDFWKATAHRCNRGSVARSLLSTVESYVSKYFGNVHAVDRFIAPSRFLKDRLVANGFDGSRIDVVHNFVDPRKFQVKQSKGEYFLYFGRVEELKGIRTLISAFGLNPKIKLVIAGVGGFLEDAKKLVELNNCENIEFVGFQAGDALHELIKGAVATLLPAKWYENCPMSVLESFAMGCPVIGTDIGGIPELIESGEDGAIVGVDDHRHLAEVVNEFWLNRGATFDMGRRARRKVESAFSPTAHLRKISDVYARAM